VAEAEPRGSGGDRNRGPVAFSVLTIPLQELVLVQERMVRFPRDAPSTVW